MSVTMLEEPRAFHPGTVGFWNGNKVSVTMLQEPRASTTGTMYFWNGTKDGQDGYVDYGNGQSNVKPAKEVKIALDNVRRLDDKPVFAQNGYELRKIPTSLSTDELLAGNTPEGKKRIQETCYAECTRIIRDIVGSEPEIFPSYFKVRAGRKNDNSGSEVVKKSEDGEKAAIRPFAHVDRDETTIAISIRDAVGEEEAERLKKKYRRCAQVNVWRPIGNVATKWPLAFIDQTQVPEWDYDAFMGRVQSRNDPRTAQRGEKAYDSVAIDDPRYKYSYASDMTPDEVWVFCSFDTNRKTVRPHGAFWDDSTPEDAPERSSIEVRTVVFFDEIKD